MLAVVAAGAAVVAATGGGPAVAKAGGGTTRTVVQGALGTVATSGMSGGWGGWTVEASVTGSGTVATADVGKNGRFTIDVGQQIPDDAIVYFTAHAPTGPATLVTVAPSLPSGNRVTLNERTTVAAAWAMAQFVSNDGIASTAFGVDNAGLVNAAGMAGNVADPTTGDVGHVLATAPNGTQTSTERAFRTLTAALATCTVDVTLGCRRLMEIGGSADDPSDPIDAFRALAEVARNPAVAAPERLYDLSQDVSVKGATIAHAPAAWTLALRFDGDGHSLSGPGNFAIDNKGDIWVNNNYEFARKATKPVCGSNVLFEFSPTGEFTKYTGGGLSGAGYGILLDPHTQQVWVSNFGFAAPVPGCSAEDQPPHNSLSLFTLDGQAVSPDQGYTQGELAWPQGMGIDKNHNLWVANCSNDTVTRYANSDPSNASVVSAEVLGAQMPFDTVDNGQHVFVSGMLNDSVQMLNYDGTHAGTLGTEGDGRFANPMGLAADAAGNVWAADSTNVLLPCDNTEVEQDYDSLVQAVLENGDLTAGSVSWISPDGQFQQRFFGGGTTLAWGITTDGDGNVWIGNFAGKRISEFCGADASTCPQGSQQTGDPISPDATGFFFDGLVRVTGVEVDQSGTLWAANNWKEIPLAVNPGGHQIVAFLGVAAPKDHQ